MAQPTFGEWFRRRRRSLGLTQSEMGTALGYVERSIRNIEAGKAFLTKETAEQLTTILDIPKNERAAFILWATNENPTNRLRSLNSSGLPVWPSFLEQPPHLAPSLESFVGREEQVVRLEKHLCDSPSLITLLGAPGVGKTRLALELAYRSQDAFNDGVYVIDFASVQNPNMVLEKIVDVLQPPPLRDGTLLDLLVSHIGHREILLVLDNMEHMVPGAAVLPKLLRYCSRLSILVTSREALCLRAEQREPVLPLELPQLSSFDSVEQIQRSPAVVLFVQRAQSVNPTFTLTPDNARDVAQLCIQVDGLPLAIVLVAAWSNTLTPAKMVEHLKNEESLLEQTMQDSSPHHQTLHHAIMKSYASLTDDEAYIFQTIAAFPGGCTEEALQTIIVAEHRVQGSFLSYLNSLQRKSLIFSDTDGASQTRWRMLETIKEFGYKKLVEAHRLEQVREAQFNYALTLARQAKPELWGPQQEYWLRRLEVEFSHSDNAADLPLFQVLIASTLEQGNIDKAAELARELWPFWLRRGHLVEGRRWIGAILEKSTALPEALLAHIHEGAGNLAYMKGDFTAARTHHEKSLEIRRRKDSQNEAASLTNLAIVLEQLGEYESAQSILQESLKLDTIQGDDADTAITLHNLGTLGMVQGHLDEAEKWLSKSLTLRRKVNDINGIAAVLANLANIYIHRGNYVTAQVMLDESLALFSELEDPWGRALGVNTLGILHQEQGKIDAAHRILRDNIPVLLKLEDMHGLAECLEILAGVYVIQQQHELAARLLGAAEVLREPFRAIRTPIEQQYYRRDRVAVEYALGNQEFTRAYQEGRIWSLKKVLATLPKDIPEHKGKLSPR